MQYLEHAPSPALRSIVECCWSLDRPAGSPGHRVLPDGCIDLLFDAEGVRVIGSMSRALVMPEAPRDIAVFGVRFHPGEAAPLLRAPARALRDDTVALEDVWGPLALELADGVLSAQTTEARAQVVERVLFARLASLRAAKAGDALGERVRRATRALRSSSGSGGVEAIAHDLGTTARSLERAFDERVGVGPKLFARVMRMQRVITSLDGGVSSWSALAADLGFADQAHLVRDVHELTGATPTALARERRRMSDSFKTGASFGGTVPPCPSGPSQGGLP